MSRQYFHDSYGIREAFYDAVFSWLLVMRRKIFGFTAYFAGGRIFAIIADEGIVLCRLGEDERKYPGLSGPVLLPFQSPSGLRYAGEFSYRSTVFQSCCRYSPAFGHFTMRQYAK